MDPLTTALVLVIIGLIFYRYVYSKSTDFANAGVRYPKPLFLLGNMAPVLFRRINFTDHLLNLYKKYSGEKYFGFYQFTYPVYVIRDPELINSIAVKNFDNFIDHRDSFSPDLDPLMASNLFNLSGDYWREMRRIVSPTFTSGKMKMMFELIAKCADCMTEWLSQEAKHGQEINMKDLFSRYTNDVVASCAFGISCNSLQDPQNEFYTFSRNALNFDGALSLKFLLVPYFIRLPKFLKITFFPKNVTEFFMQLIEKTVRLRKEQGINRPDMIQLMMESKEKRGDITIQEIASHAFLFFLAGFEPTSTFTTYLSQEIAVNPEVKRNLLEEIEAVLKETDGRPSYDAINQMKYLDAVINETLRLYTLMANMDRLCVKTFQLPPPRPGADPVTLKPGDTVWFPGHAIHRDPNYYQDPEDFKPERFLNKKPDSTVYMPFGIGPRICVGNRFAILVSKVIVFYLLAACDIEPCSKTVHPIVFQTKSVIITPKTPIWLKLRFRENCLLRNHKLPNDNETSV